MIFQFCQEAGSEADWKGTNLPTRGISQQPSRVWFCSFRIVFSWTEGESAEGQSVQGAGREH